MRDLQLPPRDMLPPALDYALVSIVQNACLFGGRRDKPGYVRVVPFIRQGTVGVCPGVLVSRRSVEALARLGLARARPLMSVAGTNVVEATGRGYLVILQSGFPMDYDGQVAADE